MGKPAGNNLNKMPLGFSKAFNMKNCQPVISDSYRQVMNMHQDLICCFQVDLCVIYANSAFCTFFENHAGNMIPSSFNDYLSTKAQKQLNAELADLQNEAISITFKSWISNNMGEQRLLCWLLHFISPGIIQASARDITDLISVDNISEVDINSHDIQDGNYSPCLSDTTLDSTTILENLPFMVWALDENLNIVFWNRECQRLTGYTSPEVVGNDTIFNRLFPDESIREKHRRKIKNTQPMIEWNASVNCANGSIKWISCLDMGNYFNIKQWKYVLVGIDRTDKKRTELALIESDRHYRSLFSSIQAGLIISRETEQTHGNIDYILIDHNVAVEQMLSKTKHDLQGKSVYELFPNIRDSWEKACEKITPRKAQERFQYYYHPRQQILEFTLFSPTPGEFAAFFEDITDIINTREELCNQLEFMQTLIDTIPNPIFFKDRRGRFFNCNKAFEMYLGLSKDQILNQTIDILESYLEPQDIYELSNIERDLKDFPRHVHHEYSFKYNGNTIDFIINQAPFLDTAGNFAGIVGILTNISEKKKMDRQLKKQLHFQQFLTDIIPAPIFFLNPKGHYFQCNKAFEDYTGKKREELIGQAPAELPECVDLWNYHLSGHIDEDALTNISSGKHFTKFYHIDGSTRDVIINRSLYSNTEGVPAGLAGVILDITPQRKAERKLTEQIVFLETLIETIPNPVYYRDLNGRLIECNRAYAELIGKPKEELIGTDNFDIFTKGQYQEIYNSDMELIASGTSNLSYDTILEFADGRKVDLLINKTILYDDEGSPNGLLGALTDLTEHREMQRSMARLDQYRIIGEMAAAIGHEVRNPMTTVRGFLQLLNESDDFVGNKEYFDLMIEEIDRANSIITDFLSLGKGLHTELKLENLNQVIENSFLILSAEAKKHDHLMQLILEEVPLIPLDFKQIRQLIFNLVRNGLEAMAHSGTLTISTCNNDDEVVLSIKDQGSGIDTTILEKLGKPFVTTKEKGTGLGLAVCYSIVERHSAQLEVQTANNGTIFNIRFPIPRADALHMI